MHYLETQSCHACNTPTLYKHILLYLYTSSDDKGVVKESAYYRFCSSIYTPQRNTDSRGSTVAVASIYSTLMKFPRRPASFLKGVMELNQVLQIVNIIFGDARGK